MGLGQFRKVDRAFLDDDALAALSDQPSVLFTAFRGGNDYTLHLLSLGAARSIEVTGVPDVEWAGKRDYRGGAVSAKAGGSIPGARCDAGSANPGRRVAVQSDRRFATP